MKFSALLTLAGLIALGTVGVSQEPFPVAPGQVTFTKDVAPILQRSCQVCHRPGSIAPMSLLTFEEARPWARAIKAQVSSRSMPPWTPPPTAGAP